MSPDDMDEVDLALLDVIAILKFYRVSLDQGLSCLLYTSDAADE